MLTTWRTWVPFSASQVDKRGGVGGAGQAVGACGEQAGAQPGRPAGWPRREPGGTQDRPVQVAGLDDLIGGVLVGEGRAEGASH